MVRMGRGAVQPDRQTLGGKRHGFWLGSQQKQEATRDGHSRATPIRLLCSLESWMLQPTCPSLIISGLKEGRRRPGMVRMGRGETTTPAVLPWHMDAVAERYAEQDSNTLKAAGELVARVTGLRV